MPDKLLYNVAFSDRALKSQQSDRQIALATQGVLQSDVAAVEGIAPGSGDQRLEGTIFGRHAALTAAELEELFSASGINAVPFCRRDGTPDPETGYYELEQVGKRPVDPSVSQVQSFDGRLVPVGSRQSHYRAIETNPTPETNPFGSDSPAEIGVSGYVADGRDPVRWFDPVTLSLTDATVQREKIGEHGHPIHVYDAQEPSWDEPVLLFDLPHHVAWQTDVRVWDDRGRAKYDSDDVDGTTSTVGNATVGDAVVGAVETGVQWQRVFVTDHEFDGRPVIENDLLRLVPDEGRSQLRAYRWTDAQYERVQLGQTPWRFRKLNLRRIGVERVDARVVFEDTSSPGTRQALDLSLKRGATDGMWLRPPNEDATPQGLVDRLAPIARTSEVDPAAVQTVRKRSEVPR